MAATDGPQFISETLARLTNLEQRVERIGGIETELTKVGTALGEMHQVNLNLDALINTKISAVLAAQGNTYRDRESFSKWPILESKSVQNLGSVSDSKSYRDWNRKLKNCIEQIRPKSRAVMTYLEQIKES